MPCAWCFVSMSSSTKRVLVEQVLEPFARGQLALRVLALDGAGTPGVASLLAPSLEILQPLFHGVLHGHAGYLPVVGRPCVVLHELDQRPERRRGMDERDRRAPDPGRGTSSITRAPQALTASRAAAQSSTRYATWWSPSPRLARNFATGESSRRRREQLDVGVRDLDECLFDAVGDDQLAVLDGRAEDLCVPGDRGFEVPHRDRDVVDLGERRGHRHRRPTGRSRAGPRPRGHAARGRRSRAPLWGDAQHAELALGEVLVDLPRGLADLVEREDRGQRRDDPALADRAGSPPRPRGSWRSGTP